MFVTRAVGVALVVAMGCAASTPASPPASPATPSAPSRRIASAEDAAAIRAVLDEFMAAITAKSGPRLTALVIDPAILFTSPGPEFDGLGAGGFPRFVEFVSTTSDRVEERFTNVQITQDGIVAWAVFDYEFVFNGKVSNYGVEAWQLHKHDGRWRIFSVVWTRNTN